MQPKNDADNQTELQKRSFIEEARRAQIIAAAIETLATEGFARTSLVRIAKRAGISAGVISYHFAGKDELLEQIVTTIYTAGAHFMLPRILAETSTIRMLRAYIESNAEFIRDHPRQIVALAEIFPNFRTKEGKLRYTVQDNDLNLGGLEMLLRQGQESGEFRTFDVHIMALTLRAAIDTIAGQKIAHPELDLDVYAKELVTIFALAIHKTV